MIVTTHGLGDCISGMILYNETISQRNKDGTYFLEVIADAGVIPGIKVDTGAKDMDCYPGEKIFQGLDGLRDPAAVPGIAFLSGGQSADLASARLNAMNVRFKSRSPWELAFSFARAIQQPALEFRAWRRSAHFGSPAGSVSSSQVQPGCTLRPI